MQLMNQQRWWLFYYDETHSTCLFVQSSSEVGFVPPERRVDKTKQKSIYTSSSLLCTSHMIFLTRSRQERRRIGETH
jgi:hypothetical protein